MSPEASTFVSSAWEANFACKQKSHYGEEDGEDEQHIRRAYHCVVGQLVRLAPHLVDIEAYGEDERRHAEQDHASKGDPASIFGSFSAPMGRHQESAGDREGNDAHDDEEKRGDPFRRQPRRDTGPVSSVDGLALPD